MDLQLVKTFLEVAESGSFASASDRLFVTQSAVSLRIQRLEDQLGAALFTRGKDGVSLTPAGQGFRPHAQAMIQHWQTAREAMTNGEAHRVLSLAAPASLWSGLIEAWLVQLRATRPELVINLSLQGENDSADLQLSYQPKARPGYAAQPLFEDQFVLAGEGQRHIHLNWGEEFDNWRQNTVVDLPEPALTLDSVAAALDLLRQGDWCAYLPLRHILPDLAEGRLKVQQNCAHFSAQIWAHRRESLGEDLRDVAQKTLYESVTNLLLAQTRALNSK